MTFKMNISFLKHNVENLKEPWLDREVVLKVLLVFHPAGGAIKKDQVVYLKDILT